MGDDLHIADMNTLLTDEEREADMPDARTADREALAAWMMLNGYATGHGDTHADLLGELDWQHRQQVNALRVLADARLRDAHAMREAIRAFLSERSRLPPADDASIDAWQARIRATTDALEAAVAEGRS